MPSDASIYSMIRPPERQQGPMEQYGSMLQLRHMMDTGALNDLQRQKLSGDLQEEDAFKAKIADWVKAGGQGNLPAEAYAASPSRAASFDKSRMEAQTNAATLSEKKMTTLAKGMGLLKDLAPQVRDEATYQSFVEGAHRILGPEMVGKANLPAAYDPEWVKRFVVKGEELFTPKPQTVNLGGREVIIDMNPWTNPKVVGMNLPKTTTPGEQQPVWDESRGVFVNRPAAPGGTPAAQGAAPAVAPGAAPAAASGAPAAVAAAPAAAPGVVRPQGLPPKPGDVHNLRNEFNALPEVKQFKDTLPIVEAARVAPDTRAGDIQLAYAVGKILDPNSVVREGELKMSADAQTTLAKYYGEVQSAVTGKGRLSPETRGELVKMLDSAVTQRETAYNQAATTYKGIAEKNGIPIDQVIITPMKRTGQEPGAPAAPKMFDKMPDPAQYQGRRLQADDGTVYTSDGKRWVRK